MTFFDWRTFWLGEWPLKFLFLLQHSILLAVFDNFAILDFIGLKPFPIPFWRNWHLFRHQKI